MSESGVFLHPFPKACGLPYQKHFKKMNMDQLVNRIRKGAGRKPDRE